MSPSSIRNFCIIAHIDHGKSTLADRMIELTHTVSSRDMRDQLLDTMDLERERGITIKLQPVRMRWKDYEFNLIDTPGHIDFTYEVSRSLAAVEGALLLVDATQGVEAQTLANLYLAIEQNLTVVPIINKIDLPAADVATVTHELVHLLGCAESDILQLSAKTGQGVEALLDRIPAVIPPPPVSVSDMPQGLIFDAQYNEYKGVVIYVRLFSGRLAAGDTIRFAKAGIKAEVLEVGFFKPSWEKSSELAAGEIGYLITNIKDISLAKVGDTIVRSTDTATPALKGYQETNSMVFAGIFAEEGSGYEKLRQAVEKLKLSDASLNYTPDHSEIFGFGFRCGFLGLLHLEIFQERLKREFGLPILITAPTVAYHVYKRSGQPETVTSPASFPDPGTIERVEQPIVGLELITPKEYLGVLMDYMRSVRAEFSGTEFLEAGRVIVRADLPLANVIVDFYDRIKKLSSGYASYSYEFKGYSQCKVSKMDVRIADEAVPALATIVPTDETHKRGRAIVNALKEVLPKQQFVLKIQAAVGGTVVAAERLSALRKDVTAKLYGGDVTRKRKLLEKQKKGKKRMASHGTVKIPQQAFLAVLKKE